MVDVFGEIFRDVLNGERGEHLIERDDGYIRETNGLQYVAEYEDWFESEQVAIDYVKGRILDVGCGLGRVTLHLQNKGFDVVGIDLSPTAIECCLTRGVRQAQIMSASNTSFPLGAFNCIIMFGNNWGIGGEPENVVSMLREFHRISSDEGIILAQSRNPLITDNQAHLDYHEMNRKRGKPPGLVRIRMQYKDMVSQWWDLLMSTPEDMNEIAEQAGWKLEKILGPEHTYVGLLSKE